MAGQTSKLTMMKSDAPQIAQRPLTVELLNPELEFTASRSDGPGGQNVNKVSSRITLRFNITDSDILTAEEKELLIRKLAHRVTKDGVLILNSQEHRSQLQNKLGAEEKLKSLLLVAQNVEKTRKKTKPSKSSREKRKFSKQLNSEKKKWRQKP